MVLFNLPPELLKLVLSDISTAFLLTLLPTCKYLNHIIRDLIRSRIRRVATPALGDIMYFECFHPVERYLRPTLRCIHTQTPGLDETAWSSDPTLSDLRALYTYYKLDVFPLQNVFALAATNFARRQGRALSPMKTQVALDEDERFTQLIVTLGLNLRVPDGQLSGFDLQYAVVRVFRNWLDDAITCGQARVLWLCDKQYVGIKIGVIKTREDQNAGRTAHFQLQFTGM
jgi:hypothetical protein